MNGKDTTAAPVTFQVEGPLGVIQIDNPPVNAISPEVIDGLIAAFEAFESNQELAGLVLECQGRTFVAGADINAFERPDFSAVEYNALLGRMEASSRPIVASLFGTVLGGGLELAMACHARVAAPGTKFGLPEILLGLMPGSLGTQRLPRLVGLDLAAKMIRGGKPIGVEPALAAGLIDAIEADTGKAARELAGSMDTANIRRAAELAVVVSDEGKAVLDGIKAEGESKPHQPAISGIARALDAACNVDFAEGEVVEAEIFRNLVTSRSSRAQRHIFMAERIARKVPGLPESTTVRDVSTVGILGAGTMGSGIAMAFSNAGFETRIVDLNPEAIQRSKDHINDVHDKSVARGRATREMADKCLSNLTWHGQIDAIADCDMIIEAVFEDMDLKCSVAEQLGQICKPGAIIATNTSTLDVDVIAAKTGRPQDVLGMHFFSPAHIMRLLEVVRGRETAPDVLQTAMKIAPKIGKLPVVAGVCYGFIGNRMIESYCREVDLMLLSGATPVQIDSVVESPDYLGMAMGPARMMDMAGVDVGARAILGWIGTEGGPQNPNYRKLIRTLFDAGHYGQKTGEGFYKYEGRKPVQSENSARIAKDIATELAIEQREISDQEIFERLLYPMINEAALILDEGIAYRASDIDAIWTSGYGFPSWQGGPLFMADEIGLAEIVNRLDHYAEALGNDEGHWTVAPLLRELAQNGAKLSTWAKDLKKRERS